MARNKKKKRGQHSDADAGHGESTESMNENESINEHESINRSEELDETVDAELGDAAEATGASDTASEVDTESQAAAQSSDAFDSSTAEPAPSSEDGDTADVDSVDDLIAAEDADVEVSVDDPVDAELSELINDAQTDLLAEMRNDLARAQAELVNFRTRVERDRAANRDAVIAEVVRALLPALDDLARAETHGDLAGSPLEIVAQKLRGTFDRYGLRQVGVKGEPFDPNLHEAVVQIPSPEVTVMTVADVTEAGYALGERLLRAAKVVVAVPSAE